MTAEALSALAGGLLSLAFSYIPGLNSWYQALRSDWKRAVMAIALLAVAAGIYGLSCAAWLDWVTCDKEGIMSLVTMFIAALVANQAVFTISPQVKASQ